MAEDSTFLGTGWSFPPEFQEEGSSGVLMVSGETDINQSLEILLHTQVGERVTQLSFGADLRQYVFQPMNLTLLTQIENTIRNAVIFYEPRIRPDVIRVVPDQLNGVLFIEIRYTILTTNTRHNLVFPYYLNEATNVKL